MGGVFEFLKILGVFQVQIGGGAGFGDFECQGGFADLARTEDGDRRKPLQLINDGLPGFSGVYRRFHPCNFNMKY